MQFRLIELFIVTAIACFACAALIRPAGIMMILFYSFTLMTISLSLGICMASLGAERAFWAAVFVSSGGYLYFAHQGNNNDDKIPNIRLKGAEPTTQLLKFGYESLVEKKSWQSTKRLFLAVPNPTIGEVVQENVMAKPANLQSVPSDDPFHESENQADESTAKVEPLIDLIQSTIEPEVWSDTGEGDSQVIGPTISIACSFDNELYHSFAVIGHCCWALLFGWCGGHLAKWVYLRSRRQTAIC